MTEAHLESTRWLQSRRPGDEGSLRDYGVARRIPSGPTRRTAPHLSRTGIARSLRAAGPSVDPIEIVGEPPRRPRWPSPIVVMRLEVFGESPFFGPTHAN